MYYIQEIGRAAALGEKIRNDSVVVDAEFLNTKIQITRLAFIPYDSRREMP